MDSNKPDICEHWWGGTCDVCSGRVKETKPRTLADLEPYQVLMGSGEKVILLKQVQDLLRARRAKHVEEKKGLDEALLLERSKGETEVSFKREKQLENKILFLEGRIAEDSDILGDTK